jgi:O-antigen/teichoic acid export membrane protein
MSALPGRRPTRVMSMARRVHAPALSFAGAGASQVLSSLSNVIISMAIARGAGASGLGAFTIAFTVYLIAVGFQRLLIGEPFHALPRGEAAGLDEAGMVGSALAYSAGCAGVAALGGLLLGLPYLLALAVVLPAVNLQDAVRYVAFRRDRPAVAAMVDGFWVVLSILAWPIVAGASAAVAVVLWGVGGAVGAVAGLWVLGARPGSPRSALAWWRAKASGLGSHLALAGVVYTLTDNLAILGVAMFVAADALGELRAGQIIVQPGLILLTVVNVSVLPRLAGRGREYLYGRTPVLVSVLTAAACSVILVATLLLLGPLGRVLFGGGVAVLMGIVVPLGLRALTSAAAAGFGLALKADQHGSAFVGARLVAGVIGLVAILAGTAVAGITGAAWGMAVQGGLYLVMMVRAWVRAGRGREAVA